MKKFADKNWVIYETYKPIKVTELGRKEVAIVVRKHRLTEMFWLKNGIQLGKCTRNCRTIRTCTL